MIYFYFIDLYIATVDEFSLILTMLTFQIKNSKYEMTDIREQVNRFSCHKWGKG
jgi:hypothetical protein